MLQPQQFERRLLADASLPEVHLSEILQTLLEHMMAESGSDRGGGIFLFEPASHDRKVFTRVLSSRLADGVKNDPDLRHSLERRVYRRRHRKRPHVEPGGPPIDSPSSATEPGSVLSVPLLDRNRVLGLVHLEASRRSSHREPRVKRAESLARRAFPAIRRAVVRNRMAHANFQAGVIGTSPAFLDLEEHLWRAGTSSRGHVLILGERGSGKELAAGSIHASSDRWTEPFVPVLTPALAESLYVDELFGHERHAFTGASSRRPGRFQSAEGGTLFFDEVGDLTPRVQAALLRVLETGEMTPIGRDRPISLDLRVVAATNRPLDKLISSGSFRQDLLDRLAVFEIRIPPLRERTEDVPLLVNYFLRKYADELGRHLDRGCELPCSSCGCWTRPACVSDGLYETLKGYSWPGNVRELKHTVLRLVASAAGEALDTVYLPRRFHRAPAAEPVGIEALDPTQAGSLTLESAVRRHILAVLKLSDYNQSRAARALDLPLSTLRSKLKKLDIDVHQERSVRRRPRDA